MKTEYLSCNVFTCFVCVVFLFFLFFFSSGIAICDSERAGMDLWCVTRVIGESKVVKDGWKFVLEIKMKV